MNWTGFGIGLLGAALLGCSSARTGPSTVESSMGGTVEVNSDAGTTASVVGGPLDIGGIFNARHVGTLAAGSKRLSDHILLRSGDLHDAIDAGCSSLNALGVRTVIDLRDEPDLSNRPDPSCGNAERNNVQITLPKLLPPSVDNYTATLTAAEPKLAALFAALTQANGPVLIHCVIGRDRATLTTALVLFALGVQEATVLADATTNQDPSVTIDATWFAGVTARIHDAGGIEAYLAQHGVTNEQIVELRNEMTQ
jgi:protein tyrosine phosphatase (PTP) superfamily phosphohydrolase (DUF442 family)